MDIFAPINCLEDAEALIPLGADELYAGVIPTEWMDNYASVKPPNRRANEHSQVGSLSELRDIADLCAENDVALYITLNAHFYSEQQKGLIEDLVGELSAWEGVSGYIIADIHLIESLSDQIGDAEILVSTGSTVFNAWTADFLAGLGADGVHLPRHLTIEEIANIRERAPPELDLYAFVLNRNCLCIDGNCTLLHNPPIEHEQAERIPCFQTFETASENGIVLSSDARLFMNPSRNKEQACGVCSLYQFAEMGLKGLKMVGRGLPIEEKKAQVTFLDRVRTALMQTDSADAFKQHVQPMVEEVGIDCGLDACYYPTVMGQ